MNVNKRHIVIVGGGTAGWMAAAALSRFAPGWQVTLVESETIGTVGVGEATIPQIHLFNRALGLDEREFLRATQATIKLGIEFDGWHEPGKSYMHAFGPIGQAQGLLPFWQHWLRARKDGAAKELSAYSLNEQAARAGKVGLGGQRGSPQTPYAFHFDAGLYAAFLRRQAEAQGTVRQEGVVGRVEMDGESGNIAAVVLDNGSRVAGDFFIDCTGFRSLLLGEALGVEYEDWSDCLPCDRAIAVPTAPSGSLRPYTRAIAGKAGWQWRIPLQHRTGNGHVFSSEHLSEDEATAQLLEAIEGEPLAEPRTIPFTTGSRRVHWRCNCVALGLAAGFMEPLESTSIHLVQSSISRLLAVLPSGRQSASAIHHFNAQTAFEWRRIRDFLVLHYWANGREGEPFWDARRNMSLPSTLENKLSLWRDTGHIHREHEELFTEVGWLQVLAGQGVEPRGYNPIADGMDEARSRRFMGSIEGAIERAVAPMPSHKQFLEAATGQTVEGAWT